MNMGRSAAVGLILAGGRATRMGGGAKGAQLLNGRALISYVAENLEKSCVDVAINSAPEFVGDYEHLGFPIILDDPKFAGRGPLVGLLAGLEWARNRGAERLLIAPCDAPFLPNELGERLLGLLETPIEAVFAVTAAEEHPLCSAWNTALTTDLSVYLEAPSANLSVKAFLSRLHVTRASFPHEQNFLNINTAEDLLIAEERLA